jgi:hypothetical protein
MHFQKSIFPAIFLVRLGRRHTVSFLALLFRSVGQYRRHCRDHRIEVGAKDCPEYELKALDFLTKPRTITMHECTRPKGDVVRYDSGTEEFAIFSADGFIRTYMKPTSNWHGLPSNLDYFQRECLSY